MKASLGGGKKEWLVRWINQARFVSCCRDTTAALHCWRFCFCFECGFRFHFCPFFFFFSFLLKKVGEKKKKKRMGRDDGNQSGGRGDWARLGILLLSSNDGRSICDRIGMLGTLVSQKIMLASKFPMAFITRERPGGGMGHEMRSQVEGSRKSTLTHWTDMDILDLGHMLGIKQLVMVGVTPCGGIRP
jgi:hypothetical protein